MFDLVLLLFSLAKPLPHMNRHNIIEISHGKPLSDLYYILLSVCL